ncbi:ubiquitin-specific protease ubp2, partial [Dipsacomyces acuminosporus]
GNGGVIDEYQGSASCWKCNLLVKFTLALPIIKPKAVDLLIATRNDIVQKDIKGSKGQLLDTLMLTHTIIKKAINGKAEPVLDKRERVKKLLKFDNAFVQLITSVGFVAGSKTEDDVIVLDGTPNTIKAYYPPAVVSKIPPHGAGGLDAVVEDLAYTRLLGAVDELSILIGALQQNVDAGLRDAVYKVSEQAPSLTQILDADNYQRLTIERTRTLNAIIRKSEMEQAVLDFSYRALGIPEDVADLIVGWAYERLLQVDTSDDPVHGPEIQRRFDSLRCISAVRESTRLGEIINFEIERGLDPANSLTSAANALLGDHGVGLEDAVGQTHVSITKDLFAVALHRLYAKDEQIRLANKLIKLANHTLNDQELFRQAVDVRLAIESQTGHPATPAKLSSPDIMGSVERRRRDTTAVKSTLPVGLKNIGNTCYLNCMLQCLFSIKPIRDAVLKLGDKATWNEDRRLGRKDGRHLLTLEDIDNGLLLVGKLKNLFQSLIDKRIGCEPDEQFAADAD